MFPTERLVEELVFGSFLRFVRWHQHRVFYLKKSYIVVSVVRRPPETEVLRVCSGGLWTAGAGMEQICSAADLVEVKT